jgi:hypothetical protein
MECHLQFKYPVKLGSVREALAFYMKSKGVAMNRFISFKGRLIGSDIFNQVSL